MKLFAADSLYAIRREGENVQEMGRTETGMD